MNAPCGDSPLVLPMSHQRPIDLERRSKRIARTSLDLVTLSPIAAPPPEEGNP